MALEGGDLHFAAERHGGEVHRDLAEEIVAVAPEELVLVDVDDDVETAGRAAAGAGFAFVLEPQLLPGGDARGDLDGDLAIARDPAGAAAGLARLA